MINPRSRRNLCPPPMMVLGFMGRRLSYAEAYRRHLEQAVRVRDPTLQRCHLSEAEHNRIWGALERDVVRELRASVTHALNHRP